MMDLFTISEHVQRSEQRTSLSQHLMVECDPSLSTKVSPLCCCDVLPREFTMQQPADLNDSTVPALTSWSSAAFHVWECLPSVTATICHLTWASNCANSTSLLTMKYISHVLGSVGSPSLSLGDRTLRTLCRVLAGPSTLPLLREVHMKTWHPPNYW
jgi:hypothetical protein